MLTLFHGEKFAEKIDKLDVDNEIKQNFKKLTNDFTKDLFEISELDPDSDIYKKMKASVEGI